MEGKVGEMGEQNSHLLAHYGYREVLLTPECFTRIGCQGARLHFLWAVYCSRGRYLKPTCGGCSAIRQSCRGDSEVRFFFSGWGVLWNSPGVARYIWVYQCKCHLPVTYVMGALLCGRCLSPRDEITLCLLLGTAAVKLPGPARETDGAHVGNDGSA